MSGDLRDLMHRVADEVAPVSVAPDTWRRARRARRRDLVVLPVAAAVVLVAGVAVGVRPDLVPSPVGPSDRPVVGGAGAVPDRIYDVPESLDGRRPDESFSHPLEPLSVVQRASAAYVSDYGAAVLVDAHDGDHHRVDLPGLDDPFAGLRDELVTAVSPDGTMLAWRWQRPEAPEDGERWPTGVAVTRLDDSGHVEVHRLPGGVGVRVSDPSFSPDGRYLTYRVGVLSTLTSDSYTASGYRIERLDLDSGERVVVGLRDTGSAPAVSDDGVVAVASGALRTWTDTRTPARVDVPVGDGQPTARIAWSGDDRVALASVADRTFVAIAEVGAGTRQVAALDPGTTTVLGWGEGDQLLLETHPDQWQWADLVLVDAETGEARAVGQVQGAVGETLSVATGLMTAEQPTAEFAPPSWQDRRIGWWVAGGLAGLVIVGIAVWSLRRRRGVPLP